jgi:hypothetical protein
MVRYIDHFSRKLLIFSFELVVHRYPEDPRNFVGSLSTLN